MTMVCRYASVASTRTEPKYSANIAATSENCGLVAATERSRTTGQHTDLTLGEALEQIKTCGRIPVPWTWRIAPTREVCQTDLGRWSEEVLDCLSGKHQRVKGVIGSGRR